MKATRVTGTIVLMLFTFFASVTPIALGSIQGDLDGNGVVDMQDLAILIEAFGTYPGHPRWNDEADLNGDGKVDIVDAVLLLTNLGKIAPTEVINVKVSFNPHVLNLKSRGKWLKCVIEIPKSYDMSDLDLSTIRLNDTVGIDFNAPITIINRGCEDKSQVMVRFNRAEVIELIKNSLKEAQDTKESRGKITIGYVTLTVTGKLSSIISFEGKARIITILP